MIDFTQSYVTRFLPDDANIARVQFDAACTITDERSGRSNAFYLNAACRSERMYAENHLFTMPNYEHCVVWAEDSMLAIRTHWSSDRDNRTRGPHQSIFETVKIDVRHFPESRQLVDGAEIVAATLENLPLVAKSELRDDHRGLLAVLEYPIKTMSVRRGGPRFQIDTGPLIIPDFSRETAHLIECFELAHVVFNRFDEAEFILRRPIPLSEPAIPSANVTDYAEVRVLPTRNQIFCAAARD